MSDTSSKLLINEPPLQVLPTLAQVLGLNEAIILQQIQYWLCNPAFGETKDGTKWIYFTVEEWQKQLPFWGKNTIRRALASLETQGVVRVGCYNKLPTDRTKWYSIDYDALNSLSEKSQNGQIHLPILGKSTDKPNNGNSPSAQDGQMELPKVGNSLPETTIPETTKGKEEDSLPPIVGTSTSSQPLSLIVVEATKSIPSKVPPKVPTKHAANPVYDAIARLFVKVNPDDARDDKDLDGLVIALYGKVVRREKKHLGTDKPLTDEWPRMANEMVDFLWWYGTRCEKCDPPKDRTRFAKWLNEWYDAGKPNRQNGVTSNGNHGAYPTTAAERSAGQDRNSGTSGQDAPQNGTVSRLTPDEKRRILNESNARVRARLSGMSGNGSGDAGCTNVRSEVRTGVPMPDVSGPAISPAADGQADQERRSIEAS